MSYKVEWKSEDDVLCLSTGETVDQAIQEFIERTREGVKPFISPRFICSVKDDNGNSVAILAWVRHIKTDKLAVAVLYDNRNVLLFFDETGRQIRR